MNRTIKEAIITRYLYVSHNQLHTHLKISIDAYNFAKRLKALKGLTPYEFIIDAWAGYPNLLKTNLSHCNLAPCIWGSTYIAEKMDVLLKEEKILIGAEKLHLNFDETWSYSKIPDLEVRARLKEIVSYDSEFSPVLDEICSNPVGRTLFRLLATKALTYRTGRKIRLVNYQGESCLYSRKDFAVLTNVTLFDADGVTITGANYYCVNDRNEITTKLATIVDVLFHEFCHALHDIEQLTEMTEVGELHRSNAILARTWNNAEELRTITGCIYGAAHDPICDHCFDLCRSINQGRPFQPRYSHRGFDNDISPYEEDAGRRELQSYLSESRAIMEGWKHYVL